MRDRSPRAARTHPSEEDYLTPLVALGASDDLETPMLIEGGITHGVLPMD